MTCAEVRFALGADPLATTEFLEAHLRECTACSEYRREMIELERKIRAALRSFGLPGKDSSAS